MKLIWMGAFLLVFASLASLVSNPQTGKLVDKSWTSAGHVLPEAKLRELERSTPSYAAQIFARLPEPIREKFAGKIRRALELMILRSLLLWHITPALLIAVIAGSLEGRWARANQKSLVKMHSPMRFSLALASLSFIPVLALLWVAAPLAISATLLVFALGTIGIISAGNLVIHAPTQF